MSAIPKRVSKDVMDRISEALDAISRDDSLARTKREIERLSGLSHATVARAFVQDSQLDANPWRLTARFDDLAEPTGRRTAQAAQRSDLKRQVVEKNREIAELKSTIALYAQLLYAQSVTDAGREAGVTPIGVNKPRRARD